MKSNWEDLLKDRLQLYGHRNWVVIADSAYPAQATPGIETVVVDEEPIRVLESAFAMLQELKHIQANVYTDDEMRFVREEEAQGIGSYRENLSRLVQGREVHVQPHEEIISKLDRAGKMFRVLIIKTTMRIPYTSVFLELECGYWNAQSEKRLRTAIGEKRSDAADANRSSL